jgi:uncharacterized protein
VTAPLLSHEVVGGAAWSVLVRAGRELRLTAVGPGANVSLLLFAAHDRLDRLNIPDTLKAQMSACIRPPMVLMSDRGTALASVTGSSLDWHDALCGHSTDTHLAAFGPTSYAADRNDWRRSARAGLLSELRKHGLDAADLHATVNLFSRVAITDGGAGRLGHVPEHAITGDWVALRAEQDLLAVMSTAPHPLATTYQAAGQRAEIFALEPYGADDSSVTFREESARALEQTAAMFA